MKKGLINNDPERIIPSHARRELSYLQELGVTDVKEVIDVERGITTSAIAGSYQGKLYVSVGAARLHPKDQPNRKVGIPLARSRAIDKFERIISAVNSN